MKQRINAGTVALIGLALALVTLSGCDNFMSNKTDFKKKLKDEVTVANAKQISVVIQLSLTGSGSSTFPSGATTVKLGVPVSIRATTSEDYGFIRWAVFTEGAPTVELTGDEVTFSDPASYETNATLNVDRSDIIIRAMIEKKPEIVLISPKNGVSNVMINAPIIFYFSKPIDPISFIGTDLAGGFTDANNDGHDDTTGLMKNITIQRVFFGSYTPLEATYFGTPTLSVNKKTLTIPVKTNLPASIEIVATISNGILDTSGLSMVADYTGMNYTTGSTADTTPPVLSSLKAGNDASYDFPTNSSDVSHVSERRVSIDSVYFWLTGGDSGGSISKVEIIDNWSIDSLGVTKNIDGTNTVALWTADSGSQVLYNTYGAGTGDGKIILRTAIYDANSNKSTEVAYPIIRDTTAPKTDAANIARIAMGGSVSAGFYNASSSIVFTQKDAGSDPVVDFGTMGNGTTIPRMCSLPTLLKWRFGFSSVDPGKDTDPGYSSKDWTSWTSVSSPVSLPISKSTALDGSGINIYFELQDDLGNSTTLPAAFGTFTKDSVPPTGTVAITNAVTVGTGKILNTTDCEVTITGNSDLSGIADYYLSASPTAPTAGSAGWVSTTVTAITAGVSAQVTVASGDGTKTVYVWFRDKAGNISSVAATDSAGMDDTDPTIEKFFINKDTAYTTEGSMVTAPATQYINSATLGYNFGFIANDGATGQGVNGFTYSDSDGVKSTVFNIGTGTELPAVQGTGSLKVSNVKKTELGSGRVLVTGKIWTTAIENRHVITLRVLDKALNESVGFNSDNQIIYDQSGPVITNMSIIDPGTGAYYSDGTKVFVKDSTQTLTVTANDAATLPGPEISGIRNYDVSGALTAPVTAVTLSAVAEVATAKTATTPLTFSAGTGAKAVTVTARDWAGNTTNSSALTTYVDTTAPNITGVTLYNGGSPMTTYSTSTASAANRSVASFTATIAASDPLLNGSVAGSGVKTSGTPYLLNVYKDGSATPLAGLGSIAVAQSGTVVNLPVDATLGHPLSGFYLTKVKAIDNVGNLSAESIGTGYYYDNEVPVVMAGLKVASTTGPNGSAGQTDAIKIGANLFVPGETLVLKLNATDKPAIDPDGSGITGVFTDLYSIMTGGGVNAGTSASNNASESTAPIPADRWIQVYNNSVPTWSASGLRSLKFTVRATDAAGNLNWSNGTSAVSSDFIVVADTIPPTTTPIFSMGGTSYLKSTTRFGDSPSLTFTPSDPVINFRDASGVKAWALTTSATPPSSATVPSYMELGAAKNTAWNTYKVGGGLWNQYDSGSVDATATLTALTNETTAIDVYLYLMDNIGNVTTTPIRLDGTNKFQLDTTEPVLSVMTVNGGNTYTNTVTVPVVVTVREAGVGLKTLELAGSDIFSISTVTGTAAAYSVDGTTITFTNPVVFSSATALTINAVLSASESLKAITVKATDAVGNTNSTTDGNGAKLNGSITLDTTAPLINGAGVRINNGEDYTSSSTVTIMIDNAADLSGIKTITLGGDVLTLVNPKVNGAAVSFSGKILTIMTPISDPGMITIENVPIAAGTPVVTVRLTDAAGNSASGSVGNDTIGYDSTPPLMPSQIIVNSGDAWTADPSVAVAMSFTETTSGIKTITFSDDVASVDLSATVTMDAALQACTVSVKTITLTTPLKGAAKTLSVTGVNLESGTQGSRKVTVTLTDASGLPQTANATNQSDTINLDSIAPVCGTLAIGSAEFTQNAVQTLTIPFTEATSGIKLIDLTGVADLTGATLSVSGNTISSRTADSLTLNTAMTSSPIIITGIPLTAGDGLKTVSVILTDAVGLNSGLSVSDTITLDNTAPTLAGTFTFSGSSTGTKTAVPISSLIATDATSTLSAYIVNASITAPAYDASWTVLSGSSQTLTSVNIASTVTDGTSQQLYIHVRDSLGNIRTATATNTLTVDTTAPTITTGLTFSGTVATALTAKAINSVVLADATSDLQAYIVTTATTAPAYSVSTWTALSGTSQTLTAVDLAAATTDGTGKQFYLYVRDIYGNTRSATATNTITVDTTAPTLSVALTFTNAYATSLTAVPITSLTIADATSTLNSYIVNNSATAPAYDAGTWTGLTGSSQTLTTLDLAAATTEGLDQQFYIHVRDSRGNVRSGMATNTLSVDTIAPTITTGLTFSGTVATTLTAKAINSVVLADATSDLQAYIVTTANTAPAYSVSTWTALSGTSQTLTAVDLAAATTDGTGKQFYLYVRDIYGNTRSATATNTITVDTTAPTLSVALTFTNAYATSLTAVPITSLTIADATSTLNSYIVNNSATAPAYDAGTWTSLTGSSQTLTTLDLAAATTEGLDQQFYIHVRDSRGHVRTGTATNTLSVDTIAPTITTGLTFSGPVATTLAANAISSVVLADAMNDLQAYIVTTANTAPDYSVSTWTALSGTSQTLTAVDLAAATTDGTGKQFYLYVRDIYGNTRSATATNTLTVDTTAPTITTGLTFSGPVATTLTAKAINSVVLADATSDLQAYIVTTANTAPAYSVSTWTALSGASQTLTAVDLAAATTDGTGKQFYLYVRDIYGKTRSATATNTITVDTTAPTLSVALTFTNAYATSLTAVPITSLTIADATSSLNSYIVNNSATAPAYDAGTWTGLTGSSQTLTTLDLADATTEGLTKQFYIHVRDSRGNVRTGMATNTLSVDTVAPTAATITPATDITTVPSTIYDSASSSGKFIKNGSITFTLSDATSGIAAYRVTTSQTTPTTGWITWVANPVVTTLPALSLTQRVFVHLKDAAGNTTASGISVTLPGATTSNSTKWTTDAVAPVINANNLNGWDSAMNICSTAPADTGGSGLKSSPYTSTAGSFNGTQIIGLTAMTFGDADQVITITAEDNVGNKTSVAITRKCTGTGTYTITAGAPVNTSLIGTVIIPRTRSTHTGPGAAFNSLGMYRDYPSVQEVSYMLKPQEDTNDSVNEKEPVKQAVRNDATTDESAELSPAASHALAVERARSSIAQTTERQTSEKVKAGSDDTLPVENVATNEAGVSPVTGQTQVQPETPVLPRAPTRRGSVPQDTRLPVCLPRRGREQDIEELDRFF